ncbi:MAG: hypothetical protein ACOZDY_04580 [Pseudomonadota bacterium]
MRAVLADIDDTLTTNGRLTARVLAPTMPTMVELRRLESSW